ncbi:dynein heavy chain 1, axonemal isoform X1 [Sigmodon hispidus]
MTLLNLFDKGILDTHTVPQLEKLVMEDIFIRGDPLLESVGLHEPLVEELRASITNAIRKAMLPLQAYAKEYRKYLELNNNDITTFLKTYQIQCPSAEEVREVVITHLKEKEILDNSLPSSSIIGPFYIIVDNVKQSLSKKRKALATSMLDILAKNLHKEVDSICEEFRSISCKIYEKPNSIEELAELRDGMKGIPEKLVILEERIVKVMSDYEVMDEFLYNLTTDDFNDKWAANNWPSKILGQIEMVRQQHVEDEEKFRKIQIMDQNNFQEKLEGLQALDKMEKEWSSTLFNVLPYKETDTFILKSPDEASQLFDDHIVMTQSMSFSPYKKPFEQSINSWETKLKLTQEVLEEWLNCQRSWLYLEPIFSSEDITRQLPVESKRYQTMKRIWRMCFMKNAYEKREVGPRGRGGEGS